MALNGDLCNRLYNFKFLQALQYLDSDVLPEERAVIEALSRVFGDSGWFEGDLHTIIESLVFGLMKTADTPQPTFDVGDRVGADDRGSAVVIETRYIQQIKLRYELGHESVFYPSFIYQPAEKKA